MARSGQGSRRSRALALAAGRDRPRDGDLPVLRAVRDNASRLRARCRRRAGNRQRRTMAALRAAAQRKPASRTRVVLPARRSALVDALVDRRRADDRLDRGAQVPARVRAGLASRRPVVRRALGVDARLAGLEQPRRAADGAHVVRCDVRAGLLLDAGPVCGNGGAPLFLRSRAALCAVAARAPVDVRARARGHAVHRAALVGEPGEVARARDRGARVPVAVRAFSREPARRGIPGHSRRIRLSRDDRRARQDIGRPRRDARDVRDGARADCEERPRDPRSVGRSVLDLLRPSLGDGRRRARDVALVVGDTTHGDDRHRGRRLRCRERRADPRRDALLHVVRRPDARVGARGARCALGDGGIRLSAISRMA